MIHLTTPHSSAVVVRDRKGKSRRSWPVLRRAALCITGAAFLAVGSVGCVGGTYGAKAVDVTLLVEPASTPATAYIIPLESWFKVMGEAEPAQPFTPPNVDSFRAKFRKYIVTSGKTPVTTSVMPYRSIYMVESGGQFRWTKIKPGDQREWKIAM